MSKLWISNNSLILASASAIRAELLRNAGLACEIQPSGVDEDKIKASAGLREAGAARLADTLAELKAIDVSKQRPDAMVIGADQVLECGGRIYDKPADLTGARATLQALRGRQHRLHTAVVVAHRGETLWREISTSKLTMRDYSDGYLDNYLAAVGAAVIASAGAYQLENLGIQLFSKIEGDYFAILGLPLLPLIGFLRLHGLLADRLVDL